MKLLYSLLITFFLSSSLFGGFVESDWIIITHNYKANDGGCPAARDLVLVDTDTSTTESECYNLGLDYPVDSTHLGCRRISVFTENSCEESPNGDSATFGDLNYDHHNKNRLNFTCGNTCEAPNVLDEDTCACVPPPCDELDPELDCDNNGILNKFEPDFDLDGDGIINSLDPDDDGDGIADALDPDHPDYNAPETDCKGPNTSNYTFFPSSPFFAFGDYTYESFIFDSYSCKNLISSSLDSIYWMPDLNPSCNRDYCFSHYVSDCIYSVSDRLPSGYIYNSSAKNEDACTALIDGIKYSARIWDVPSSLSCPNTAYCFLKLIADLPLDSNSENNDTSMEAPDLNSTTTDLAPLLNAQNTSNKHLQDLKDKTDLTNDKLDSLSDINNQILTANKDSHNRLEDLVNNNKKLLSNSDLMNTSLSNMNKALSTSNQNTKAIHTDLLNANLELDNITNNTKAIDDTLNDGLFGDLNPFDNLDIDELSGESTFDGLGTTASDKFGLTHQTNIFGLSSLTGGGLSSISFSMYGTTYTVLSVDTISSLPIDAIRGIFMFIAAISGFIIVFRTV